MNKQVEYTIVTVKGFNQDKLIDELSDKVTDLMKLGWQTNGAFVILAPTNHVTFFQPMVRSAEDQLIGNLTQ